MKILARRNTVIALLVLALCAAVFVLNAIAPPSSSPPLEEEEGEEATATADAGARTHPPSGGGDDGSDREYDWIVVGSGVAASIVAGKISATGDSVLVLESGERIAEDDVNAKLLGLAPQNWVPPFVRDSTVRPPPSAGRSATADVLVADVQGGGGMVNSGISHLGAKGWWRTFGDSADWDYDTRIVPAFRRLVSRLSLMPPALHPDSAERWVQSGGAVYGVNADLNAPLGTPSEGFGNISVASTPSPIFGVVRDSTLFGYLDPSDAAVSLRSHATRLLFDRRGNPGRPSRPPRASGVEFIRDGACRRARARKGVVVSAGAFGSPELLLRSGVGDAGALAPLGIDPVANVTAVGRHLTDHHAISLVYRNGCPLSPAQLPAFVLTPGTQVAGFIRSNASVHAYPDVQYAFVPLAAGAGGGPDLGAFTLVLFLVDPQSAGSVELAGTADPLKPSIKRYDYVGTERDVAAIEDAVAAAERFMAAGPFAACLGERVAPLPSRSIRDHITATVYPGYHPAGTCRIGEVVDSRLRVRGTRGLWVVDASVFPSVSPCNTAIPTAVVAENSVDMLLADAAAAAATDR
jgi:choline dehydrogenase